MANRRLYQFTYSNLASPTHVFVKLTAGSAGAVTLAANSFVKSITHNGTGDYTIVFTDLWTSLLGMEMRINSGSSAPAAPGVYIKNDSVATAASKSINFIMNAAGTAADPASGEIILLDFIFKNSSNTF